MFKVSYNKRKIFILINQLLIILFLIYEFFNNKNIKSISIFTLLLVSIIVVNIMYIELINLKQNRVLVQFTNLLVLLSWYFLFLFDNSKISSELIFFLSPIIVFESVRFLFVFFFQDYKYNYQKGLEFILKLMCALTVVSKFIDNHLFALLYLLQIIISLISFIFLIVLYKKTVILVLKCEKRNFIYSAILLFIFLVYAIVFSKKQEYVENLGMYLIISLAIFSIHNIAIKDKGYIKQNTMLNGKKRLIFISLISVFFVGIGKLLDLNIITYFIIIHCIFWFTLLYFILIYTNIDDIICNKNSVKKFSVQESNLINNLMQIYKEEELKKDFSNYLHDEVLQDLLSIKNMMKKSENPDVKYIIVSTLEKLNLSIRNQMQDYHPILLKTLTLKENIENMFVMVRGNYLSKNIEICFTCEDNIFLAEPYNFIIYRILKELVTNAFKHSNCSKIEISLIQKNKDIILSVLDNGVGVESEYDLIRYQNNGLSSIQEQLHRLNGVFNIDKTASGFSIVVKIPMEGENYYKYFINR